MFRKIKSLIYEKTEYGKTRYLNFLYQYDLKQFYNNSAMCKKDSEVIAAKIRILVHTIEKGLSLSNPKPGFGKEKIQQLVLLNEEYKLINEKSDIQIDGLVKAVVKSYVVFQKKSGIDVSFIPKEYIEEKESIIQAGAKKYIINENDNFSKIAYSRHSSRSFSNKKVDHQTILEVIKLAQTAPSACNRQATRIYACINEDKISQIMKMHGGLNGFDKPAVIFAVTGDLKAYQSEFERNVVFVDGGIFIMNLLYSLNSFGIMSCPIIWGSEPDMDDKLERLLNIPHSHKIVALVVAGYSKNQEFTAAVSYKRNVKDIVSIIN